MKFNAVISNVQIQISIFIDWNFIPVPEVLGSIYTDKNGKVYKFIGFNFGLGKYKTKIIMDYNDWYNKANLLQKLHWILRDANYRFVATIYPTSLNLVKKVKGVIKDNNQEFELDLIELEVEFIIASTIEDWDPSET